VSVHGSPDTNTDERLGGREKRQDIVTLISNLGTGNLDKSGIVCTGFKAKLARPFSINLPSGSLNRSGIASDNA
jgi:hypothetical protein